MSTLDIRSVNAKPTEIKFDSSQDRIIEDDACLTFFNFETDETITLVTYDNLDDFIKACQKAKELWGAQ